MLHNDRPEFDRQVSLICAAYNVPLGERAEAYWVGGFHKLRLDDWIRIVTFVIGPDGPEKMPTSAQLWGIRKKLAKLSGPVGRPGTPDLLTALVENALTRWHLSEIQVRQPWNWIGRDVNGPDCAILGVIIPQDPTDAVKYPAHRLMVEELEQARAEA